MNNITFRIDVYEENDGKYSSICPELNLSAFGVTPAEAKAALLQEIRNFFSEAKQEGTLEDVLIEAGFRFNARNCSWEGPKHVAVEKFQVPVAT